jgi:hypothetical protein
LALQLYSFKPTPLLTGASSPRFLFTPFPPSTFFPPLPMTVTPLVPTNSFVALSFSPLTPFVNFSALFAIAALCFRLFCLACFFCEGVNSERSSFVGSGTKTSSGASKVPAEVVVGRADSMVTVGRLVMVEMVALGYLGVERTISERSAKLREERTNRFRREPRVTQRIQLATQLIEQFLDLGMLILELLIQFMRNLSALLLVLGRLEVLLVDLGERLVGLGILQLHEARREEGVGIDGALTNDVVELVLSAGRKVSSGRPRKSEQASNSHPGSSS